MALTITTEENTMALHTVTERLYETEDGRAVPEGHPDARWLLAVPGQQIPEEVAAANGILTAEPEPEPEGLDGLKKAELVALAEERGLPSDGTKAALIERLTAEPEPEPEPEDD